jgi:hypothetical protein
VNRGADSLISDHLENSIYYEFNSHSDGTMDIRGQEMNLFLKYIHEHNLQRNSPSLYQPHVDTGHSLGWTDPPIQIADVFVTLSWLCRLLGPTSPSHSV